MKEVVYKASKMSCKSERLMFQAFLIASFLANLCYSQDNLALHKEAIFYKNVPNAMNGDGTANAICRAGKCNLVVDLGTDHVINTVIIRIGMDECEGKQFTYSIELQKNETSTEYKNEINSGFLCKSATIPIINTDEVFNKIIHCLSKEAHQIVVFRTEARCRTIIFLIDVNNNLALKKDAKFIRDAPESVDGDSNTNSSCWRFGWDSCELVVDLGAFHLIETVIVKAYFECRTRYVHYSLGLQKEKKNKEYNCENKEHRMPSNSILSTTDTITSTTTTSPNEPSDINSAIDTSPTEPSDINSAIGMKMDWSCYLALLLAVLFGSVSCILHHLYFLGKNLIGVVVGMQGRKDNEE